MLPFQQLEFVLLPTFQELYHRTTIVVFQIDSIELAGPRSLTFCVGDFRDPDASVIISSN